MSFLSKNKSHFYVEFLGWMECRGVRGSKYTDPIIRELKRRQQKTEKPPKLTIQVSKKDIKVTQEVEDKKKKSIKKVKFPAIPARDVTYVRQGTRPDGRPDDIVACIYLGYMPRTQRYVHVHVYRFDEAHTAATFARQISALVEHNHDNILQVERDLTDKGELEEPGDAEDSTLGSYSDDDSPGLDLDPDLQSLHEVECYDNVTDELKHRLQLGDKPLLLPPKDYDTLHRVHGNLNQINQRRCLNLNVVGDWMQRERNQSAESGVDMASPSSENPPDSSPHHSLSPPSSVTTTSPSIPRRGNSLGRGSNQGSSHHSGSRSASPDTPTERLVYPPKVKSPPISPKIGGAALARKLNHIHQNNHNHQNHHDRQPSDGSVHGSHHSSEDAPPSSHHGRPPAGTIYYKGASNNDIYSLPSKAVFANGSPRDIPQPDYLEEDVQLRQGFPGRSGAALTRSMPADLIRSEMALHQRPTRVSEEFPHSARAPRLSEELPPHSARYFNPSARPQHSFGADPAMYAPKLYGNGKR